jgi:2-polyprenyl-3-methyl-5-hydroxy-6-metoxy-1,4-benzoquinol methylase
MTATLEKPVVNPEHIEAFGQRLLGILNHGSLGLMISIGHRTGLFDCMADTEPATASEIAERAALNERYVREWLGAMTVGRIVSYDSGMKQFSLPPEHAACLTRASAPNNIAAFCQYIGLLGSVEDQVVKCFHHGGGVPYCAFCRFQEVMAEDSGQSVLPAILDHILPLAPGMKERLAAGIDVLDVGCGRGLALNLLAAEFPKSRFVGYDISEEGIATANSKALEAGLKNLRFEVRDAAKIDETATFDLIFTFDAVHDQAEPAAVLKNIARALKADGVYLMQDIAGSSHVEKNMAHPMGSFLYTVSTMHCMTVSLAGGGAGLGAMWGEELALLMLEDAGFTSSRVERLSHDVQNAYFINRK